MGYLRFAAIAVLAFGVSSYASLSVGERQVKAGVAYQGASTNSSNYRPGIGVNGFVGTDGTILGAGGTAGMGVRANYEHYRVDGDIPSASDQDEGGIALTGMVGPNTSFFQPKLGGHVGYARLEENNYLDLGPDATADLKLTPQLGVHALITPSWFVTESHSNYFGTKLGLGVIWSIPGA